MIGFRFLAHGSRTEPNQTKRHQPKPKQNHKINKEEARTKTMHLFKPNPCYRINPSFLAMITAERSVLAGLGRYDDRLGKRGREDPPVGLGFRGVQGIAGRHARTSGRSYLGRVETGAGTERVWAGVGAGQGRGGCVTVEGGGPFAVRSLHSSPRFHLRTIAILFVWHAWPERY